ncbi:hypothetical protein DFH94DRAFT_699922 [Russula ochroleuca]|uniref:Uncharacterized protein n=1 Tax=Russula ochroleuca TaxID=152965 RepID=A0A9P5JV11_9AGAM|nr:hypothetical protein DFH94DRAFT_699922 [Russula ochroleuca]
MPKRELLHSGTEKTCFLSSLLHCFDKGLMLFIRELLQELGEVAGLQFSDAGWLWGLTVLGGVVAGGTYLGMVFLLGAVACQVSLLGALIASSLLAVLLLFRFCGGLADRAEVHGILIAWGEPWFGWLSSSLITATAPEELASALSLSLPLSLAWGAWSFVVGPKHGPFLEPVLLLALRGVGPLLEAFGVLTVDAGFCELAWESSGENPDVGGLVCVQVGAMHELQELCNVFINVSFLHL